MKYDERGFFFRYPKNPAEISDPYREMYRVLSEVCPDFMGGLAI